VRAFVRPLPLLLALALLPAPARAASRQCPVISTVPAFMAFAAATRDLDPAQRAQLFVRTIVPKYPGYYLVAGIDRPEQLIEPARAFFAGGADQPGLRPFDPARLDATIALVERDFPAIQDRFLAAFPDFACRSDLVFGITLGRFDGAMVKGAKASALLFGLDVISRLQTAETLPVLFQHELFHLYHRQRQPAAFAVDPLPVWWGAWSEGLAAYVSGKLNPNVPEAALLGSPPDLPQQIARNQAATARLVLDNLDGTGDIYTRLFTANETVPGYPPRPGYYFGYLLARELGATRSLDELARMPPAEVRAALVDLLTRESRGPA